MLTNVSNYESYYSLLKNLPITDKLDLINKISISIKEDLSKTENKFFNCFGKLNTKKSADELIDDIYNSRNFTDRNIILWKNTF